MRSQSRDVNCSISYNGWPKLRGAKKDTMILFFNLLVIVLDVDTRKKTQRQSRFDKPLVVMQGTAVNSIKKYAQTDCIDRIEGRFQRPTLLHHSVLILY